jgi:hypothetical protein
MSSPEDNIIELLSIIGKQSMDLNFNGEIRKLFINRTKLTGKYTFVVDWHGYSLDGMCNEFDITYDDIIFQLEEIVLKGI